AQSLGEALDRVRLAVADVPSEGWLRGLGWRDEEWRPPVPPRRQALDAVTGDVPTARGARDYHSLWLNSAALPRADGQLQVLGGDLLRVGYVKVFMDGTLGSRTARMLDGTGVEITSRAELADIIRRGAKAAWPVAVHAIGDLANREALDAFEETAEEWRPRGL